MRGVNASAAARLAMGAALAGLLALSVVSCGREAADPPVAEAPAPSATAESVVSETAPDRTDPPPAEPAIPPSTSANPPETPPEEVPLEPPPDEPPPETLILPAVPSDGDPVVRVQLEAVTFPELDGNGDPPQPGLRHIRFHLLVENITDSPQIFIPWQDLEVTTGGGQRWYDTFDPYDSSLDGSLLPGLPVRGTAGFQIPEEADEAVLSVNLEPVVPDRDIPVRRRRFVIRPDQGPFGEPGSDPVFTPRATFRVGDSFIVEDFDFTLRFTVEGADFPEVDDLGNPPPPGMRHLKVFSSAEVTSGFLENLDDLFIEARTPDGFRWQEQALAGTGLDGEVGDGQPFRGAAVFPIPEEASVVYLTVENTFNGFYGIFEIDARRGAQGKTADYPRVSVAGIDDSLENDRWRFSIESIIYFDSTEEMEEGVPDFRIVSIYAVVESADGQSGFFDGWPVFQLCEFKDSRCFFPLGILSGDYAPGQPLRGSLDFEFPGDVEIAYLRPRPGVFDEFSVIEIDTRLGDQGDPDAIPVSPDTTGVLLSAPARPAPQPAGQTPAGTHRNGPAQAKIFLSAVTN